jgi:hypothetical protein
MIHVIHSDLINSIELYRNDNYDAEFLKLSVILPKGYSLIMTKTINIKTANTTSMIKYDEATEGKINESNNSQ